MRAVVQRVCEAQVVVDESVVAQLARPGLLVLVGITHSDDEATARRLAAKIWGLRILEEERSASDLGAPILVVSQFTLYADTARGRRPSWSPAAPGDVAEPLVTAVVDELARLGAEVCTGTFGAHMRVHSVNDGPVTVILDM